ncbi:MAG: hypothetical protein R3E58_05640 [Phycisphaerae bacterium]
MNWIVFPLASVQLDRRLAESRMQVMLWLLSSITWITCEESEYMYCVVDSPSVIGFCAESKNLSPRMVKRLIGS